MIFFDQMSNYKLLKEDLAFWIYLTYIIYMEAYVIFV